MCDILINKYLGVTKMKPYRNIASGTNQILYCSNPLRLDTYQGCEFKCKYCFAHQHRSILRQTNPEWAARKIAQAIDGTLNKSNSAMGSFATFVAAGWPIHWGGMADPFPYSEKQRRVSWKVLHQFTQTRHPLIISTKSTVPGLPEYLSLLKDIKDNLVFQMSIITSNQDTSKLIEPKTPTAQARIKTLKRLCNAGIKCLVRIQPFITEFLAEQQELFKIYADIGVKGIIVEGLRMRGRTHYFDFRQDFEAIFGYDIKERITRFSVMNNYYYPIDVKLAYHKVLQEWAKQNNLMYLVADNDLRFLGDSPNCCGQDLITANTNQFNINNLAYYNPDDFGYHLIQDNNADILDFNVSGFANAYQRGATIREHLRAHYNDVKWTQRLSPLYVPTYIDTQENQHYYIKYDF